VSTESIGLEKIAQQFAWDKTIEAVSPLGNGNINSTYLITLKGDAQPLRFVLQRINAQVFPQPELVIQNMAALCEHLHDSGNLHDLGNLHDSGQKLPRRWETPQIMPTQQGDNFWRDDAGDYWRAISFIENSHVRERVEDTAHAREVGYGLAMFHSLISTLSADRLADTLPGFHITPSYVADYERVLAAHAEALCDSQDWQAVEDCLQVFFRSLDDAQAEQAKFCLGFVEKRKAWAHVLEQAKESGHLHLRPIHGDPKVNNILLGDNGEAVSLIDLDTIKPGLVHYDIGDCLRSGCNRLGEETEDWEQVAFDAELAEAMLQGYLSLAGDFLTEQDYDYLYDAIRLIAFELGLRFFTDYLAGNVYFKVRHPTHNLTRALVQFKLTESIEQQADTLKAIIQQLR